MAILLGAVVVGLVLAIAAAVVIREAGRLAQEPPPPIFDADEAYEWVVEELPEIVAATLTPDDVRRILDFQLELFERAGLSANGHTSAPRPPVVIGGSETVDYILERAATTGEAYLPEQVYAVVETQLRYLREIGAVGPAAPPEDAAEDTFADGSDGGHPGENPRR